MVDKLVCLILFAGSVLQKHIISKILNANYWEGLSLFLYKNGDQYTQAFVTSMISVGVVEVDE